jgi:hypothetical protein
VRRGICWSILALVLLASWPVLAQQPEPDRGNPAATDPAQQPGEFRVMEFDIDLFDAEQRAYPYLAPGAADLLVRLPAQGALGGRTEIQSGELTFVVDGDPVPFAATGPKVRVALLAFRDPEAEPLNYEFRFAYRDGQGDPQAGLVPSPYLHPVVAPREDEPVQSRFSLYTNENLHTRPEIVGTALLLVVGLLAAWYAAGRVLFRGLLFGRRLEVSTALLMSNLVFGGLVLVLGLGAAWAWFNPGVNGPYVQYFGYLCAFAVFAVLTVLVGLFGRAIDAR